MSPLISPEQLRELIDTDPTSLRILDVRWRLDRPNGHPEYLEGHLPGAVYVDLDHELAEHGRPATEGRHPLPSAQTLQEAARRWGINPGDTVVVYDDVKNTAAARAWWLLKHAEIPDGGPGLDIRVLDGALTGWKVAGYALETGEVTPETGAISIGEGYARRINIDDAAAFPEQGTLLDVRAPERYRGEHEPMDPKAGHIPGAVNAPTGGNVDDQGRFLSPEQLRERFLSLGVDPEKPVASYCGSGINAAHATLALDMAGFDAVLYPGSFSEWSNHQDRPVASGE